MPEIKDEVHQLADTMRGLFTPPDFVPGCLVKSLVDISEYATNNGWIEAIVGQHGQQRVRYYGEPSGLIVDTSFVDVEYFPAYRLYRIFGSSEGGESAVGGVQSSVSANNFSFIVKNTSGATAAAGDVGYLDANNEFQTTTTAEDKQPNPVAVVVGGANNADIYVTKGGGRLTLNYSGSDPSAGDFLTFSTTAGQVVARATMHPRILARARAAGSGGTVDAELLLRRVEVEFNSAVNLLNIPGADASDFVAVVAAAGVVGDKVYHNPPSSGAQNCVSPNTATELAKIILHNTTRAEEAFIIEAGVDGTDDFIRVTNSADISAWGTSDDITTRSQTNTSTIGVSRWFDCEIISTSDADIDFLTVLLTVAASFRDTGAVDERLFLHPYKANNSPERQIAISTTTATRTEMLLYIPLIRRRFCILWTASGSGTALPRPAIRKGSVAY